MNLRERQAGEVWTQVVFVERIFDVIRRQATQSVVRVGMNQPIMREKVLEQLMEPTDVDGPTESVAKESAEKSPVVQGQPVKKAKNGLRKIRLMVRKPMSTLNNQWTNPMLLKSKAAEVVM